MWLIRGIGLAVFAVVRVTAMSFRPGCITCDTGVVTTLGQPTGNMDPTCEKRCLGSAYRSTRSVSSAARLANRQRVQHLSATWDSPSDFCGVASCDCVLRTLMRCRYPSYIHDASNISHITPIYTHCTGQIFAYDGVLCRCPDATSLQ